MRSIWHVSPLQVTTLRPLSPASKVAIGHRRQKEIREVVRGYSTAVTIRRASTVEDVVTLMVAVFVGDMGSSIAVTLNAMRIARMKAR